MVEQVNQNQVLPPDHIPQQAYYEATIQLIAAHRKKSNIGIGVAILLVILFFILLSRGQQSPEWSTKTSDPFILSLTFLLVFILIISNILWYWGLYHYAKSKGQSGWTALLGLLNLIGILVLILLPNRFKNQQNHTI